MKAREPEEIPQLFLEALNSGNADLLASIYELDGALAPNPSNIVRGHKAIKEVAAGFFSQKPRFALQESETVTVGDIALIRSRWVITNVDASGVETAATVCPTLVARRQSNGDWLVVIDSPRHE